VVESPASIFPFRVFLHEISAARSDDHRETFTSDVRRPLAFQATPGIVDRAAHVGYVQEYAFAIGRRRFWQTHLATAVQTVRN
jgi:hypothetical protein